MSKSTKITEEQKLEMLHAEEQEKERIIREYHEANDKELEKMDWKQRMELEMM